MIRFYDDVLFDLDLIYRFENSKPVAHARHTHLLQFGMLESNQSIACDSFVCQQNISLPKAAILYL